MFRAGEWQATRKLVATTLSWCANISCADGNGTVEYSIAPSICSCLTYKQKQPIMGVKKDCWQANDRYHKEHRTARVCSSLPGFQSSRSSTPVKYHIKR